MITPIHKHLAHSWLLLLGIGIFSFGMAAGVVQSVQFVAQDFTFTGIPHIAGRVAGASVSVTPGPVTLHIATSPNPATYVLDLQEPTSVYNLLRLAKRATSLTAEFDEHLDGTVTIRTINRTSASGSAAWIVKQNGTRLDTFADPVLLPGDNIELSLGK
ncbi:MAG: hypothetical protein V1778_04845 [bacterium]